MTPGRSLFENTSGRSMAPVAKTMARARSTVSDCRAVAAAALMAPLDQAEHVAVIDAEGRRPRHERDVADASQFAASISLEPTCRPRRRTLSKKLAAEQEILLDQRHPRAGCAGASAADNPAGPPPTIATSAKA